MIPVICAGCRGGNDDKISTFAMTNDPAVRRAYVPSQEGQVCVLRDEHDLLAAGASEVLMNSLMTVESMNEHSERSTTTFGCAAPSWSARASTVRAEVVLAAHRHKRNAPHVVRDGDLPHVRLLTPGGRVVRDAWHRSPSVRNPARATRHASLLTAPRGSRGNCDPASGHPARSARPLRDSLSVRHRGSVRQNKSLLSASSRWGLGYCVRLSLHHYTDRYVGSHGSI
jgi:hypothetical protein